MFLGPNQVICFLADNTVKKATGYKTIKPFFGGHPKQER